MGLVIRNSKGRTPRSAYELTAFVHDNLIFIFLNEAFKEIFQRKNLKKAFLKVNLAHITFSFLEPLIKSYIFCQLPHAIQINISWVFSIVLLC